MPKTKSSFNYFELINLFSINNAPAEIVHVGKQRGTSKIIKHRNSLYGILGAGIFRNHRANPAAALRAHATFCHPVLLSGLPALILTKNEITRIHKHHKNSFKISRSSMTTLQIQLSFFWLDHSQEQHYSICQCFVYLEGFLGLWAVIYIK